MRVPARVRLADVYEWGGAGAFYDTPAVVAPAVVAPDLSIPSYQLSVSTPLGSAGGATATLPTSSPSTTVDWFKALPNLITSGAALTGAVARIVQGSPTSTARPIAFGGTQLYTPTRPLMEQPIFWIGSAAAGLVVLLALFSRR